MTKIDEQMRLGLERHQAGRLAEAEAIYRKVLDKQPSHAAANHLLGVALLQRGDPAAAIPRLQRAVAMRGNDPEYLGNLGTALNGAGRPEEAVAAFDRALNLQPRSPAILNNKAMALKALYRHDDAIAAYRAAIALAPSEAGFSRNLGNALAEMADWHGAEAAYREALGRRPNFPNALTGLCLALEALGRNAEAIATAAEFAARFPDEPETHRALGHANWIAGEPAAAAAAYRAAIAVAPADAEAHRMLGTIVPRQSEDDEVLAIERLLERTDLKDDQRAQLEFALGVAFDDIGDGERSFEHFSRGNAIMHRLRPFDLAAARAELEELEATYAALPDSDIRPLAAPDGPIFIVGLPRSGKTTLEAMLASHPDVFPAGELQIAGIVAAGLRKRGGQGASLGSRYLEAAAALAPGKRIIDTMPNNFRLIGALRLALPSARVIHCTRSPQAHAAALFQKYFAQSGNEYTSHLPHLLAYLPLYRQLMTFWNHRFPGFLLDIDTADIRENPDDEMRRLLPFAGLSWDQRCAVLSASEPRLRGTLAETGSVAAPLLRAIDQLAPPPAPAR